MFPSSKVFVCNRQFLVTHIRKWENGTPNTRWSSWAERSIIWVNVFRSSHTETYTKSSQRTRRAPRQTAEFRLIMTNRSKVGDWQDPLDIFGSSRYSLMVIRIPQPPNFNFLRPPVQTTVIMSTPQDVGQDPQCTHLEHEGLTSPPNIIFSRPPIRRVSRSTPWYFRAGPMRALCSGPSPRLTYTREKLEKYLTSLSCKVLEYSTVSSTPRLFRLFDNSDNCLTCTWWPSPAYMIS